MCTVIIVNRAHRDFPVVLAANRDELYERPAAPPRLWPGESPFVAPVDLSKGGTWIALSPGGFVAAITNQRTWDLHAQAELSRGELVVGVARAGSRSAARRFLESIDARLYNPFNLLFGDATGLEIAYGRGHQRDVEIAPVLEGVHVLANDRLDSAQIPKVRRIRARLATIDQVAKADVLPLLEEVLRDREPAAASEIEPPPPGAALTHQLLQQLDAVAIETERYGTRCSSIIALEHGRASELRWADGPPHRTPFEDRSDLVDLLVSGSTR